MLPKMLGFFGGALAFSTVAMVFLIRRNRMREPTKYCYYCGDPVAAKLKECPHCGTTLDR